MTFELLPSLAPWLTVYLVVAAVGALSSVAGLVWFATDNRRERVRRHESIPGYYRHLLAGH